MSVMLLYRNNFSIRLGKTFSCFTSQLMGNTDLFVSDKNEMVWVLEILFLLNSCGTEEYYK